MRNLMIWAALVLGLSAPAAADWVEGSIFGITADNPQEPQVLRLNTYKGYGPKPGEWVTVDVTEHGVPADAVAVFLAGRLLTTHGQQNETCHMWLTLRAPGSDHPGNWKIAQIIEPHQGGGQRDNMATWVPVRDGKFEAQWNTSTTPGYPARCSYGMDIKMQAYVR